MNYLKIAGSMSCQVEFSGMGMGMKMMGGLRSMGFLSGFDIDSDTLYIGNCTVTRKCLLFFCTLKTFFHEIKCANRVSRLCVFQLIIRKTNRMQKTNRRT